ncbi:putative small nuclear ribonucleoprotein associated protein b [Paratrimastix pyriformis]|uniref:Sm protein B n=1 Tax=Paratrimastix pyriformis TaxID=342808 RepID=A0ABQ8UBN9_9EUKA|nr:putative small nuclear ribonucleoprotein associated protein b [Paratrimastix pyriformis]
MTSKKAKLENFLGWRLRAVLNDGRNIIGRFMAFDRHMNLVLGDSEEYRLIKPKKGKKEEAKEQKRHLGLILLRGENIVTFTPEGAPPSQKEKKAGVAGVGVGRAAGRGMAIALPGAGGPLPVAAPVPQHLMPTGRGMPGLGRGMPGMPMPAPGPMPGMPFMPPGGPMPGSFPPPGVMPPGGFPPMGRGMFPPGPMPGAPMPGMPPMPRPPQ